MDVSSRKIEIILETAKCQELLRLIPDLQCHHCKDVPGPKEKEKNRYSCIDSSHTLCEKDKLKCPCGSLVGKNPSPIIAKLLEGLPLMCQNYKRGCREIKMDISGLEFHQQKCIFRKVYCPKLNCSMESRNIELLFKDVMKHLNDFHGDDLDLEMPMIEDETNAWRARLGCNFELRHGVQEVVWSRKMKSTCGAIFFFEVWMIHDAIHCWLNFFGSLDDAKKFIVNFSISNKFCESFIYNGPVHTLDKKQSEILGEQSCFFIKLDAVKRCLNKKSKFDIRIAISKNVKEQIGGEDNAECDESEEEPSVKKRRRC